MASWNWTRLKYINLDSLHAFHLEVLLGFNAIHCADLDAWCFRPLFQLEDVPCVSRTAAQKKHVPNPFLIRGLETQYKWLNHPKFTKGSIKLSDCAKYLKNIEIDLKSSFENSRSLCHFSFKSKISNSLHPTLDSWIKNPRKLGPQPAPLFPHRCVG